MKTPLPLNELPEPLQSLLGYEFYEESPVDHRVREYLLNPDPEERWKFYARVDDLAQDIARLLEELAHDGRLQRKAPAPGRTIYLAESTSDVAVHRDNVEARARAARPPRPAAARRCRLAVEDLTAAVSEDLARVDAVDPPPGRPLRRPAGERGAVDPPPADRPRQRASPVRGGLTQLIWIPEALDTTDDEPRRRWWPSWRPANIGTRRRGRAGSARGVQGLRPRPAAPSAGATAAARRSPTRRRGCTWCTTAPTARRSARCRPSWSGSGSWSCCRSAKGPRPKPARCTRRRWCSATR